MRFLSIDGVEPPPPSTDMLLASELHESHASETPTTLGHRRLAPTTIPTMQRAAIGPFSRFSVYLLLIIVAELLITFVSPSVGLSLYAIMLLAMILHGAAGPPGHVRNLTLALTLAPLTRLLSLSLPLATLPQIAWYPLISVLLMIAIWGVIRTLGLSAADLHLQSKDVVLQLSLAGGGLGLGSIEYRILGPNSLVANPTFISALVVAPILVVFTGFSEELIFRGLLQHLALLVSDRWGLIYVSLLFAALHIGYRSFGDVAFAFTVGLLFALIVRCTGSIIGVSLAHGLVNVTLFLIMPYVAQNPPALIKSTISVVMLGGAAISIVVLITLARVLIGQIVTQAEVFDTSRVRPLRNGLAQAKALAFASRRRYVVSTLHPSRSPLRTSPIASKLSHSMLGTYALSVVALDRVQRVVANAHQQILRDSRVNKAHAATPKPTAESKVAEPYLELVLPFRYPQATQNFGGDFGTSLAIGLVEAFKTVPDPRSTGGQRHALPTTLAIATCAMISGAHSVYAIARWGRNQRPEILSIMGLVNKRPPCAMTYHRIFSRLDPTEFESAVMRWARMYGPRGNQAVCVDPGGLRGVRGTRLPGVLLVSTDSHNTDPLLQNEFVHSRTSTEPMGADQLTTVQTITIGHTGDLS